MMKLKKIDKKQPAEVVTLSEFLRDYQSHTDQTITKENREILEDVEEKARDASIKKLKELVGKNYKDSDINNVIKKIIDEKKRSRFIRVLVIVLVFIVAIVLMVRFGMTEQEVDFSHQGLPNSSFSDSSFIETSVSNLEVLNLPELEADGYEFVGWFNASSGRSRNAIIGFELQLNYLQAKWEPVKYTIMYENTGNSIHSNPSVYTIETDTITLEPATREGYTFVEWKTHDGEVISEIEVGSIGDVALTAQWNVNSYTMTFDTQGGSTVISLTEDYGANVSEPSTPTKDGYNFQGWYSDSKGNDTYSFDTMPSEDMTLYAKWEIKAFSIIYESEGVLDGEADISHDNPSIFTYKDHFDLKAAVNENYVFEGWYNENDELVTAIDKGTMSNLVLTSKWTRVEKLDAPVIDVSEETLTYDQSNVDIRFYINGEAFDGDLSSLNNGTYEISAYYLSDSEYYADSDLSESITVTKLPTPIVHVESNEIIVDQSFDVEYFIDSESFEGNLNELESGEYKLTVRYNSDDSYTLSSNLSAEYHIEKPEAMDVSISTSTNNRVYMVWDDSDTDSIIYSVDFYKDNSLIDTQDYPETTSTGQFISLNREGIIADYVEITLNIKGDGASLLDKSFVVTYEIN